MPYIISLTTNASGDVFAGADFGGGVFRSTNHGDSWTLVNDGLTTSNNVNALLVTTNGDVFAGIYGDGVFRSEDNGDHWTQVNDGLTATFVLSFTTNASGDVFAGAYFGGGVFRSTDRGETWSEKNAGLTATDVRATAVSGNDIFAGTYGIGMFRSSDLGESWQKVNNGLSALYVRSLAVNASGDIFAGADFVDGSGGIFRSTDNGASWTDVSDGVITTDVRALAIDSSSHMFAGTYFGGGVFRSTDNGESWVPVNDGQTCGNIWSLAINAGGDIFAGSAGCEDGVYRSTDGGDHWTLVNTGLTSTDIAALAIAENGHIFAGTVSQFGEGGGIFRSTDNGDTWTERAPASRQSTSTPWQSTPPVTSSPAPLEEPSVRQQTATIGPTSAVGSSLSVEMPGRWQSMPAGMRLPGPRVAGSSAARNRRRRLHLHLRLRLGRRLRRRTAATGSPSASSATSATSGTSATSASGSLPGAASRWAEPGPCTHEGPPRAMLGRTHPASPLEASRPRDFAEPASWDRQAPWLPGTARRRAPLVAAEDRDAGLSRDGPAVVAAVHRGRRGEPRRARRRSRGDALHQRRPADTARRDRERRPTGVPRLLRAVRRLRLLGRDREVDRPIRRLVPLPAGEGRPSRRGGARLPVAQGRLGKGLCDRGIACADREGLHRLRRPTCRREHDGRERRIAPRDGEGRPEVRPDLPSGLARQDRGRRGRRRRVRADEIRVVRNWPPERRRVRSRHPDRAGVHRRRAGVDRRSRFAGGCVRRHPAALCRVAGRS